MASLFFLFSGEHAGLPFSELKAILEAENHQYTVTEKLDQVVRLKTKPECTEDLKRRAALTRLCAQEILVCEAKTDTIIQTVNSVNFGSVLKEKESFVVRVRHVREHSPDIDGWFLERKLGEVILQNTRGTKVKLRDPDKTFIGILTSGKFVLGLKLAEISGTPFVDRRPRKRPFFHPSAMQAKLARCMVNLAQLCEEDVVLDPFCGTGTMLIEAALIGCSPVGLDVQKRMAKGTLLNFDQQHIRPEGIILADAKTPPLTRIDGLVTDPPYGTSSTTMKRTTRQLIEESLTAAHALMEKGRKVCIAAPKKINLSSLANTLGYKHLESHFVYVHRSLTREIAVLEKE